MQAHFSQYVGRRERSEDACAASSLGDLLFAIYIKDQRTILA